MVDQSQQSPFVGSYGQLRLAAVVPSKTSAQQNIEGNQPAKGAAQVPGGTNPKNDPPGAHPSPKPNNPSRTSGSVDEGSILPYLLGPAGLAAGAGATKMALDRYSKGASVGPDEMAPYIMSGTGNEPGTAMVPAQGRDVQAYITPHTLTDHPLDLPNTEQLRLPNYNIKPQQLEAVAKLIK